MPKARTSFRCVIVNPDKPAEQLCTGILVNVPAGLTRPEAVAWVTGAISGEIHRYAAWEALGFGPIDLDIDWSEIVT
jgi:hypothetical protein